MARPRRQPKEKQFRERVQALEMAYGSQKKLARSLGVSDRTVRRWKNRETPPAGSTKFNLDTLKRRERYQFREVPRREADRGWGVNIAPKTWTKELYLNSFIRSEAFADIANGVEASIRYPVLFARIAAERPDITYDAVIISESEVYIPSATEAMARLSRQGTIRRFKILGRDYRDLAELESLFWADFRTAYPNKRK